MSLLDERSNSREAHRRYLSSGRIAADLLREPVLRSWERCHDLRANPRLPRAELMGAADLERLLERQVTLVQTASHYMRMLSQAAGDERHAAMLGDEAGIVLEVVGDEQSVRGPESVPGPGSLLSEANAGSNGIGTPLAEGGYAELVGAEHFIQGFHPFTCQGVPVRDPDQRTIGVVSVSVRRTEAGERLREILTCAVHGIETELIRARLERDVQRVVSSGLLDPELLERLRQDLVQSSAAAQLRLESASRKMGRSSLEQATQLLQLADDSIRTFRRQAWLWQELATPDIGSARPLELGAALAEIAGLLRTEAAIRGVELAVLVERPVVIVADPRTLRRSILGLVLRGISLAGRGGSVIATTTDLSPAAGEVLVRIVPAHGQPDGSATELRLSLPAMSSSWHGVPPEDT